MALKLENPSKIEFKITLEQLKETYTHLSLLKDNTSDGFSSDAEKILKKFKKLLACLNFIPDPIEDAEFLEKFKKFISLNLDGLVSKLSNPTSLSKNLAKDFLTQVTKNLTAFENPAIILKIKQALRKGVFSLAVIGQNALTIVEGNSKKLEEEEKAKIAQPVFTPLYRGLPENAKPVSSRPISCEEQRLNDNREMSQEDRDLMKRRLDNFRLGGIGKTAMIIRSGMPALLTPVMGGIVDVLSGTLDCLIDDAFGYMIQDHSFEAATQFVANIDHNLLADLGDDDLNSFLDDVINEYVDQSEIDPAYQITPDDALELKTLIEKSGLRPSVYMTVLKSKVLFARVNDGRLEPPKVANKQDKDDNDNSGNRRTKMR